MTRLWEDRFLAPRACFKSMRLRMTSFFFAANGASFLPTACLIVSCRKGQSVTNFTRRGEDRWGGEKRRSGFWFFRNVPEMMTPLRKDRAFTGCIKGARELNRLSGCMRGLTSFSGMKTGYSFLKLKLTGNPTFIRF